MLLPFQPTTDEIFLPAQLPKKIDAALKKRKVDSNIKSGMCREVLSGLIAHEQSSNAHLRKATKKNVEQVVTSQG